MDDDAEDFLSKVDDVSRLIDGLASNKLSAEYVATRTEELGLGDAKGTHGSADARAVAAADAEHGALGGEGSATGVDSTERGSCKPEDDEDIKRKVRELQERRNRRLRARERYQEHMRQGGGVDARGTDYAKWDLWTPSDEEDELFENLQPNNDPGFKAMSKDIEERHARMKQQRQLSERYRSQGNEEYRRRQYAEAMKLYQTGIELGDRTNAAIHSNCAMAALKCGCNATAIECCDKAIHIIEFFHNNNYEDEGSEDAERKDQHLKLRMKTYQRRGTARMVLEHFVDAVRDFETAVRLARLGAEHGAEGFRGGDGSARDDRELERQLQAARVALGEHKRERNIRTHHGDADPDRERATLSATEDGVRRMLASLSASLGELSAPQDEETKKGREHDRTAFGALSLPQQCAVLYCLMVESEYGLPPCIRGAGSVFHCGMNEEVTAILAAESPADVRTHMRASGTLDLLCGAIVSEVNRLRNQTSSSCSSSSSEEDMYAMLSLLQASCTTEKNLDLILANSQVLQALVWAACDLREETRSSPNSAAKATMAVGTSDQNHCHLLFNADAHRGDGSLALVDYATGRDRLCAAGGSDDDSGSHFVEYCNVAAGILESIVIARTALGDSVFFFGAAGSNDTTQSKPKPNTTGAAALLDFVDCIGSIASSMDAGETRAASGKHPLTTGTRSARYREMQKYKHHRSLISLTTALIESPLPSRKRMLEDPGASVVMQRLLVAAMRRFVRFSRVVERCWGGGAPDPAATGSDDAASEALSRDMELMHAYCRFISAVSAEARALGLILNAGASAGCAAADWMEPLCAFASLRSVPGLRRARQQAGDFQTLAIWDDKCLRSVLTTGSFATTQMGPALAESLRCLVNLTLNEPCRAVITRRPGNELVKVLAEWCTRSWTFDDGCAESPELWMGDVTGPTLSHAGQVVANALSLLARLTRLDEATKSVLKRHLKSLIENGRRIMKEAIGVTGDSGAASIIEIIIRMIAVCSSEKEESVLRDIEDSGGFRLLIDALAYVPPSPSRRMNFPLHVAWGGINTFFTCEYLCVMRIRTHFQCTCCPSPRILRTRFRQADLLGQHCRQRCAVY